MEMAAEAAVDICPERMDAAAPRIVTVVEFCSGVGVETAAVDSCPERMHLAALYRF